MGIKRFSENRNRAHRALQIWLILVAKASNRQTITYKNLSQLMDFGGAGVMSQFLGPVMDYCEKNGLPPLTVLVVQTGTGSPGSGLTTVENQQKDTERVFNYNWFDIIPPTVEDLSN